MASGTYAERLGLGTPSIEQTRFCALFPQSSWRPLSLSICVLTIFATGCIRDYDDFAVTVDISQNQLADAARGDKRSVGGIMEVFHPDGVPSDQGVPELVAPVDTAGEVDGLQVECGNGVCLAGSEDCESCPADCGCFDDYVCWEQKCCLPQCIGEDCGDNGCGVSCGTVEVCDGEDNDCNGYVDEDLGTFLCGGTGECELVEVSFCQYGELTYECSSSDTQKGASEEECDGLDNDCDGDIDEGLSYCCEEGEVSVCGTNDGACKKGVKTCDAEMSWGDCGGDDHVGPVGELCNNKDDDCDGQVDEENPGGGNECPLESLEGSCAVGMEKCLNGSMICGQVIFPTLEKCDGEDNDCDGEVDEEGVC